MSGLDKIAAKRDQNGSRILYDRDKMPDGLDADIWHITLLFEQVAETYGCSLNAGRPVAYMEINHRVTASNLRENFDGWLMILEQMVKEFWDHILDYDKSFYAVNEFCKSDIFAFTLRSVIAKLDREGLLKAGIRAKVIQPEKKESKRTSEDSEALNIILSTYNEEEIENIIKDYIEHRQSTHNENFVGEESS